jgi:hypothetical protein
MPESFYVVWRRGGGAPTVEHLDYLSTENEARRLAGENPGKEFVVLEAKCIVRGSTSVTIERMDGETRSCETCKWFLDGSALPCNACLSCDDRVHWQPQEPTP